MKANNQQLIEDFYVAHYERLLKMFFYSGIEWENAKDLVQDVFLKLLEYRELIYANSIRSLVNTIAINRRNDYLRRLYIHQEKLGLLQQPDEETTADAPDVAFEAKELHLLYKKAVQQLPPQRRLSYLLVTEKGTSMQKASELLGISVKTIDNNLWQSRMAIRNSLSGFYKKFYREKMEMQPTG